ncbi:hypothetical protein [Variovorax sp. KK3]|uniref:hypothetical protein n=1 Tax=Variovorax sp. KK3 TaxID=1855728 RepID=UPI00097C67C6|nr:hypothetical protein [Variovorax sp. KK3]
MSPVVAAPAQTHPSSLQPLEAPPSNETGIAVFFSHVAGQVAYWAIRTWYRRSRRTQLLLTGMAIISCSFSLSMLVSAIAYPI